MRIERTGRALIIALLMFAVGIASAHAQAKPRPQEVSRGKVLESMEATAEKLCVRDIGQPPKKNAPDIFIVTYCKALKECSVSRSENVWTMGTSSLGMKGATAPVQPADTALAFLGIEVECVRKYSK